MGAVTKGQWGRPGSAGMEHVWIVVDGRIAVGRRDAGENTFTTTDVDATEGLIDSRGASGRLHGAIETQQFGEYRRGAGVDAVGRTTAGFIGCE